MKSFFEKAITDLQDLSNEDFKAMCERMGYEVAQDRPKTSESTPAEH